MWVTTTCELCSSPCEDDQDYFGNLHVRCPICGRYSISYKAFYHYFSGLKQELLSGPDRQKLSEHCFLNETGSESSLDMDMIERLTGRKCV